MAGTPQSSDLRSSPNHPDRSRPDPTDLGRWLEAGPILVWQSERRGVCSWVNQATIDFFGRPLEELAGQGWSELIHPEDLPMVIRTIAAAGERDLPWQLIYRVRHWSGELVPILVTSAPRFDERGVREGYLAVAVPIQLASNTPIPPGDRVMRQCVACERLEHRDGAWYSLEHLPELHYELQLTHCPECMNLRRS